MNIKQKALSAAVLAAMGTVGSSRMVYAACSPPPNGVYNMVIVATPTGSNASGTFFKIGKNGAWNSSFTFGQAPGAASQGMTDNALTVTGSDSTVRGSSIGGDGYAGIIKIAVTSGTFTVSSFNVDVIPNTAGGNFAQYVSSPVHPGDTSAMTGTIDASSCVMTFTPTGRLGAIDTPNTFWDNKWNVDPGATAWTPFTTGTFSGPSGTISGMAVTSLGDVNGDGLTDFKAILVSGGKVGTAWGQFAGATFYETWNVQLLSTSAGAINAVDDPGIIAAAGTPVAIDVLGNDSGGLPPLSVQSIASAPAHGTAIVLNTGCPGTSTTCVQYKPAGSYSGPDSFIYKVQDSSATPQTATATVSVTVNPAGAPTANDVGVATDQNVPTTFALAATATATGATLDCSPGGVTLGTPTQGGSVVNAGPNTSGACTVTYKSASGYVGKDTFTYSVKDSNGNNSNTATATVTVNDSPQASSGTYGSSGASNTDSQGVVTDSSTLPTEAPGINACTYGCWDFKVTNITANPIQVVLKMSTPLDAGRINGGVHYRKVTGTGSSAHWINFDTSGSNMVESAPLAAGGGCPSPAASGVAWVVWPAANAPAAAAGHQCLRLTIADNTGNSDGPDDSDPAANNIADPGGVNAGTDTTSLQSEFSNGGGGGCSLATAPTQPLQRGDWWLVAGFLGWLGWSARGKRTH